MDHERNLYRASRDNSGKKQESWEEKWDRRGRNFWKAFLFTKDGKPKSSLMIYTFSLSLVFVVLLVYGFFFLADLTVPMSKIMPVFLANLLVSLIVSAVGILCGMLLHHFFSDKRLFFGTYLWLTLYLVAYGVISLIDLRGTGGYVSFLAFYLWFFVIPVLSGTGVSAYLYQRDHVTPLRRIQAQEQEMEAKPWKKYTNRSE